MSNGLPPGWRFDWRRGKAESTSVSPIKMGWVHPPRLELVLVDPTGKDAVIFYVKRERMETKPRDWDMRMGVTFAPIDVFKGYVDGSAIPDIVTGRKRDRCFHGWHLSEAECQGWLDAFIKTYPDYWMVHAATIEVQRIGHGQINPR